jgi:hypothetical protein
MLFLWFWIFFLKTRERNIIRFFKNSHTHKTLVITGFKKFQPGLHDGSLGSQKKESVGTKGQVYVTLDQQFCRKSKNRGPPVSVPRVPLHCIACSACHLVYLKRHRRLPFRQMHVWERIADVCLHLSLSRHLCNFSL